MRFDSSDLMALLRLFKEADDENMPRQIERIEKSKPHDKNALIRFQFGKKRYALLIDSAAEDDEYYIQEQVHEKGKEHHYTLLKNPVDDLMSYGAVYKGKECYLLFDEPTEQRLDIALVERFGNESRSTYQKRILAGQVSVNGKVQLSPRFAVKSGDSITISTDEATPEKPFIDCIYEDDHVMVINKQPGLLTHAKGALVEEFTASDVIKPKTTYKSDTNRPGIVHRLDRDTSGVLLMVKTDEAAHKIQQQFSNRTTKKTYYAIVSGVPKQPKALIDLPIGRNPSSPSTFRVDPNGKPAQTTYEVITSNDKYSLLKLVPKTGRTHQLRVHMQYIGTPILGDVIYGSEKADRMYLHAASLEVTLPGGERKIFEAPLPDNFEELAG